MIYKYLPYLESVSIVYASFDVVFNTIQIMDYFCICIIQFYKRGVFDQIK